MAKVNKVRKGKKRWIPVYAPALFENKPIGETYVYEPAELIGRQMTVNVMHLTGNPKKQNLQVFFRITKVAEGKAQTKPLGIEMQQSSLKRMVRRGRTKIADSFVARTKKNLPVRVQPILVTKNRVDLEVQRALRKASREVLKESIVAYSFDSILNDVVNMRLQRYLKEKLNTIAPLKSADIRLFRYEVQVDDEDDVLEETNYVLPEKEPRPAKKKASEEDNDLMKSLKEEVEEALAADDGEKPAKKAKKKAAKKTAEESDDESSA